MHNHRPTCTYADIHLADSEAPIFRGTAAGFDSHHLALGPPGIRRSVRLRGVRASTPPSRHGTSDFNQVTRDHGHRPGIRSRGIRATTPPSREGTSDFYQVARDHGHRPGIRSRGIGATTPPKHEGNSDFALVKILMEMNMTARPTT